MMNLRHIAILGVAALALVGAGAASARPAAAAATTVRVTAKDFSFALSTKTVKRGLVTFVITNRGHDSHDFAIAGRRSKIVSPGHTTRLSVMLKPGRYAYRCTVDSHAELGMKGVLRVRP